MCNAEFRPGNVWRIAERLKIARATIGIPSYPSPCSLRYFAPSRKPSAFCRKPKTARATFFILSSAGKPPEQPSAFCHKPKPSEQCSALRHKLPPPFPFFFMQPFCIPLRIEKVLGLKMAFRLQYSAQYLNALPPMNSRIIERVGTASAGISGNASRNRRRRHASEYSRWEGVMQRSSGSAYIFKTESS